MLTEHGGHRFSIQGRTVKYFKWQFEYGVRSLTGPGIFDVRFQNKRIAYEVSLQDYASFFSSAGPFLSSGHFFYSLHGLGKTVSLVRGVDCPEKAVYMDSTSYFKMVASDKQSVVTKDAICMFEINNNLPLRRHRTSSEYGAHPDNVLVTRFVLDIQLLEADVIFDYIFHQNGALEVKATITGYPVVNYKFENVANGYEIYNNHIGMIHDDFLLFKTDLDVDGANNSFLTLSTVTGMYKEPWDSEPVLKKKLKVNNIRFEKEAAIPGNSSLNYFIVYNKNSKNKFMNNRGYRLQILSPTRQIYPDDHIATLNAEWTKYKLSVTKYHKNETSGACLLNTVRQKIPPACSFDQRINNSEYIENTDIVAWVTIGGLQIPTSEDFPTITSVGNQYSFLLRPFNFIDEDASMTSSDSVYFKKTDNYSVKNVTKTNACNV